MGAQVRLHSTAVGAHAYTMKLSLFYTQAAAAINVILFALLARPAQALTFKSAAAFQKIPHEVVAIPLARRKQAGRHKTKRHAHASQASEYYGEVNVGSPPQS